VRPAGCSDDLNEDQPMSEATRSPYAPDLLDGKRILITGGGTGLGRGVARHLVEHGAEVHLWGRRQAVLDEAAAEASASHPGRVRVHTVDVRQSESVETTMDTIWSEHGPLTGVVNNAAANFITQTKDLSPRAFDAVTGTVMHGSFNTTLAAGKRWIANGLPGSVLSTLTTWIWTGSAYVVPSAMAKAAVHAMTMSLAVEWAKYGIRINALAPGPIPTDYAWEMLNPTEKSAVGATQVDAIPAGRAGTMQELAHLTMFLLSDACDYITGAVIPMDGGQMLAGPATFAGLNSLTDADWTEIKEKSKAATATSKSQRTV
jgi:NAD(P)-dependent dehydrogenase (short-subunit alcohol dehydrogenase family)